VHTVSTDAREWSWSYHRSTPSSEALALSAPNPSLALTIPLLARPRPTPQPRPAVSTSSSSDASSSPAAHPPCPHRRYRYYLTGATSDLVSLPGDPKPSAADVPFTIESALATEQMILVAALCPAGAP
jgi:hypothetical protein